MQGLGRVEKYLKESTNRGTVCAALIDPEDFSPSRAAETAKAAVKAGISLILIGGSTISDQGRLDRVVMSVKNHVSTPVILFPGNVTGVSHHADAIFFSSLLNSTNPYFLIGAQALGAPEVRKAKLEAIPMGYLVFGDSSATGFVGQVNRFPPTKPNLAVIYAMAAEYLGMRTVYLEAGSGTSTPIPAETIRMVRKLYGGILIVGGGITNGKAAANAANAGADILVIGNLLSSPGFEVRLREIVSAIRNRRTSSRR